MKNAGLEKVQAGIKVARRNTNNLRCADDTTLMAESKEELKSLLMKVRYPKHRTNFNHSLFLSQGPTTAVSVHYTKRG